MIRSQTKMIDDLENCYNSLCRSLIQNASFVYNANINFTKDDILNLVAKIIAESLEPLLENDAVMTVEEFSHRLLRMDDAGLASTDDEKELHSKIYGELKKKFDLDKKLDTYCP